MYTWEKQGFEMNQILSLALTPTHRAPLPPSTRPPPEHRKHREPNLDPAMRRLALHASALSDAEYEVYTACLRDLVDEDTHSDGKGKGNEKAGELEDDAYFERMHVGVREARAWLRGRYAGVGAGAIDAILKLFSPTLAHGDTLSGSEFFAALRLVTHADNGNDGGGVDRSLAFVQAVPSQKPSRSTPSASQPSSPAKRPVQLPPPMPSRRTYTEPSIAPSSSSSSAARAPDSMPHDHYYSHQQPPLHPSQRTESFKSVSVSGSASVTGASTSHSAFNPFVPRAPRSEDGSRLPPLPPRKPPPPIPPPRNNNSHRVDRSLSPSKFAATPLPALVSASASGAGESSQPYPNQNPYASTSANPYPNPHTNPNPQASSHPKPPPPVPPPKHVTSTLMKQSLHASKVAQTMKRAEAQLEKERVMQVLKSSSIVSGSYSLAGARVSGSSVVVGTNIHNQHQYQQHHPAQVNQHGQGNHQELRHTGHAPQIGQLGQTRNTSPARYSSSGSSVSASISDAAPPLPRRRHQYQQQPSPPLSASSLEQVALAAPPVPPSFSSGPPSTSTGRTSSRTHNSHSIADSESTSAYMYAQSPFRSPPPPPPPTNTTVNDSPEGSRSPSPTRAYAHGGAEFPSGPPPTHPDRKPLGYFAYQSPSRSNSNLESFEAVYGPGPAPSMSSPFTTPSGMTPSTPTAGTPTTPNFPRVFRSKSMHQTSSPPIAPLSEPPPLAPRRKRPESVQVLSSSDVLAGSLSRGSSVVGHGATTPSVSGHAQGQHRRSSLSVSSTPSSHSQAQSQSGHGHDHSHSPFSMNSLQKTIAGLQPKLDKARYKAEAGLSRRGFVRDAGGRAKFGVEGEEEEGLMPMERGRRPVGTGTGTGKERERPAVHRRWTSREDVDGDEGFFDEPQVGDHADEVDGDEDEWTRSRGMGVDVSASPVRRRLAGGEEDTEEDVFGPASPARRRGGGGGGEEEHKSGRAADEEGMEQDNLKWPAGEGWKPL